MRRGRSVRRADVWRLYSCRGAYQVFERLEEPILPGQGLRARPIARTKELNEGEFGGDAKHDLLPRNTTSLIPLPLLGLHRL